VSIRTLCTIFAVLWLTSSAFFPGKAVLFVLEAAVWAILAVAHRPVSTTNLYGVLEAIQSTDKQTKTTTWKMRVHPTGDDSCSPSA
jgi:hypothetical protein